MQQFVQLTATQNEERSTTSNDLNIIETLIKYLIFEGCSHDLRAHFLEHKLAKMSLEEFQELGGAYQAAHGRQKKITSRIGDDPEKPIEAARDSSMQAWRVSVEDTLSLLRKLPTSQRRTYVLEKKLCFNCLKAGHHGKVCRSPKRCDKCGLRHHSMLHLKESEATQKTKVNLVSLSVRLKNSSDVFLMTAVVVLVDKKTTETPRSHVSRPRRASILYLIRIGGKNQCSEDQNCSGCNSRVWFENRSRRYCHAPGGSRGLSRNTPSAQYDEKGQARPKYCASSKGCRRKMGESRNRGMRYKGEAYFSINSDVNWSRLYKPISA